MKKAKLRKELKSVGATLHEADKLAEVAELVGSIKMRGLSAETKHRLAPTQDVARRPRIHAPHLTPAWKLSLGGSFATACILLIVAQSALPGSILYPVKRSTEAARLLVQPSYNDVLVEKREDEVEQLKAHDEADPIVIEEAEKNYQNTLERSLNQRGKKRDDSPQELPDKLKPRYEWSKRWYQDRKLDKNKSTNDQDDPLKSLRRNGQRH